MYANCNIPYIATIMCVMSKHGCVPFALREALSLNKIFLLCSVGFACAFHYDARKCPFVTRKHRVRVKYFVGFMIIPVICFVTRLRLIPGKNDPNKNANMNDCQLHCILKPLNFCSTLIWTAYFSS